MQPLHLSDTITTTISPNQIHKLIDKLKQELYQINSRSETNLTKFSISKVLALSSKDEEILQIIQGEFQDRYKPLKVKTEYQVDLLALKEALFHFNVTNEISIKLSLIERYKIFIRYYSLFKECGSCSSNNLESINKIISYYKEFTDTSDSQEINLQLYDWSEANEMIKDLKQKTLQLEKEITKINGSGEIKITIHQSTAEFLGLG